MTKETQHPHDLSEKGKKYDALKKEYNELKTLNDQVLAQRLKAEAQRDEFLKVLEFASEELGRAGAGENEWMYKLWIKINNAIKSNSND